MLNRVPLRDITNLPDELIRPWDDEDMDFSDTDSLVSEYTIASDSEESSIGDISADDSLHYAIGFLYHYLYRRNCYSASFEPLELPPMPYIPPINSGFNHPALMYLVEIALKHVSANPDSMEHWLSRISLVYAQCETSIDVVLHHMFREGCTDINIMEMFAVFGEVAASALIGKHTGTSIALIAYLSDAIESRIIGALEARAGWSYFKLLHTALFWDQPSTDGEPKPITEYSDTILSLIATGSGLWADFDSML